VPEGLTLHAARLPPRIANADGTDRQIENVQTESRNPTDADAYAIVLTTLGPELPRRNRPRPGVVDRIEAASGRRANTAPTALIEAVTMSMLRMQRLAIAAPRGRC
jgi:hypothetical protein